LLEDRLAPATLTVNSTADTASDSDPYLSLRQAFAIVNSSTLPTDLSPQIRAQISGTLHQNGADTIGFDHSAVTAPIVLGGFELLLTLPATTAAVTIDGGTAGVTVDANRRDRVLEIRGVQASLLNLTLTHGSASPGNPSGGCIYAFQSSLTVSNCSLTDNYTEIGPGGAINTYQSSVSISNSTLSGNSCGAFGGAIDADTLTVSNCTLTGNSAENAGGAIEGTNVTVADSILTDNTAYDAGGIEGSTLTVTNCTLAGNSATDQGGGLRAANYSLTISNSTLTGNTAGGSGGAIYYSFASATVTNCFLTDNSAPNGGAIAFDGGRESITACRLSGNTGQLGGAILVAGFQQPSVEVAGCTLSQNTATDEGGAIRASGGTLTVDGCLLESNSAARGGALASSLVGSIPAASVTTVHSLFTLNSSADGGGAIASDGILTVAACSLVANIANRGGGLLEDGGTLTLLTTTVSSNSGYQTGGGVEIDAGSAMLVALTVAQNAASSGGGLFVATTANPVLLRNSIIWGNTDLGGAANDIGGANLDPSSSYNLIGTGGSGGLTNGVNHNLVGVADAGLLPLANNGGATLSYALAASSPARGAGDPTLVGDPLFGFDQRDVARTNPVAIGSFQP
jgi:predicted outer membrane repeat protein